MPISASTETVPRIIAAPPALPPRPRHFVGRAKEIMDLAHAFAQGPGAILWGAGGIGKTTLGLEAVYRQDWRFTDGILWFPLAGGRVGFSDLLTVHLGVPPGTPAHQLRDLLAHRCSLFLLDSFEDAPDQEAALDFLANLSANGCRALITTRELVTLKDWKVIELPELPPDQALRLFWQLLPEGKRDPAEAAEAAIICALLGGHPLAIELAAAQQRDFKLLADLRAALEKKREHLLHDPRLAAVQEKDRNVYYSFSLSYERLSAQAQENLPRLAVFFTPWSEAGALAVTGLAAPAWLPLRDECRRRAWPCPSTGWPRATGNRGLEPPSPWKKG